MSLVEGQQLPAREYRVTRADLVRYAGASGDRNPIHWSDRTATEVGLPGVVAHGMYTFALAARAVESWLTQPEALQSLSARFSRPVVVPDDDRGAAITVAGRVTSVADGRATLQLAVTAAEQSVLGAAVAVVGC